MMRLRLSSLEKHFDPLRAKALQHGNRIAALPCHSMRASGRVTADARGLVIWAFRGLQVCLQAMLQ